MKRILTFLVLGFLITALFFTGCGREKIRVGSKLDPESLLLAQMIILILSENGYDVIDKTPTGETEDLVNAFDNNNIDVFPEYTGNKDKYENRDVVWLKPGPADNKWGIAITQKLSVEKYIKTLEKFFSVINDPDMTNVKIICSHEFTTNEHALPAFERKYDRLNPDRLMIVPGSNTEYMGEQASKTNNAAMTFTTDGHLEKYSLVLLEDNLNAQVDFHPAPLVSKEIYLEHGEDLNRILTPLFISLDDNTLRELNSEIGLGGRQAISEVARKYLIENGYFMYNELRMVQNAMDEMMKGIGSNTIPAHYEATNNMENFPNTTYRLYWKPEKKPDYAKTWDWPPLTWRITRGTYSCDEYGIVTQHSTGW